MKGEQFEYRPHPAPEIERLFKCPVCHDTGVVNLAPPASKPMYRYCTCEAGIEAKQKRG